MAASNPVSGQWTIGYQYYGGISTWYNSLRPSGVPARSPIKAGTAKPTWMLAADFVIKFDGIWGNNSANPPPSGFSNLPAHRSAAHRTAETAHRSPRREAAIRWAKASFPTVGEEVFFSNG